MHFNLVNVVTLFPNEYMRNGYSDVMETVAWGLGQLGHQVTIQVNEFNSASINIVFGGHMLPEAQFARVPENTIFYNLEDLEVTPLQNRKLSIFNMAERFRVWDFYEGNVAAWREHKLRFEPLHIPIAYAPTLRRVTRRENPMIDALFYGSPGPPRLDVLAHMAQHGIRLIFAHGLYGAERDDLISHAKIALNLYKHNAGRIFEITRVAFLLANAKAVLSEFDPQIRVESDLDGAIAFTPRAQMTEACLSLLADDTAREALAQRGFEAFQKRDIRIYLSRALASMGYSS